MLQRASRARPGIEYGQSTRGILHYYTERAEFEAAREAAALMRRHGLDRAVKTVEEADRDRAGARAGRRADRGRDLHALGRVRRRLPLHRQASRSSPRRGAWSSARGTRDPRASRDREGRDRRRGLGAAGEETIAGDAFVVALGAYSALLTRPLGVDLPIYPAKGYSATVAVTDAGKAPEVSLTDDEAKIVISRLGDRTARRRHGGTFGLVHWT